MLNQWWGYGSSGIPIYPGMVWGLDGALPDATLAEFTDYNDYVLRGTDSDDAVGTGTEAKTLNFTTTTNGAHSGPADIGLSNGRAPSGDTYTSTGWDTTNKGAHSHQISVNYRPRKNVCRLVQAMARRSGFPAGSILFSGSAAGLEGCVAFDLFGSYGGLLAAGTANERKAPGAGTSCSTVSVYHSHTKSVAGSRVASAIATAVAADYMTHTHAVSVSANPNLYRTVLAAWQATEEVRRASTGIIVLYIGEGVPGGWRLCDGTDGTPDTVNRYIYNQGTPGESTDGLNRLTVSATLDTRTHSHGYSGTPTTTGSLVPHKGAVGHNHTATGTKDWQPPHRFIKFIQYGG